MGKKTPLWDTVSVGRGRDLTHADFAPLATAGFQLYSLFLGVYFPKRLSLGCSTVLVVSQR